MIKEAVVVFRKLCDFLSVTMFSNMYIKLCPYRMEGSSKENYELAVHSLRVDKFKEML